MIIARCLTPGSTDGKFVAAKSSVNTIGSIAKACRSVLLRQVDQELDVEGLVERGHLREHRLQCRRVEGLQSRLRVGYVRELGDECRSDCMSEQHDDLVGLAGGTERLTHRSTGLHEHRLGHAVPLTEHGDRRRRVTGPTRGRRPQDRRRECAELGKVGREVRIRVGHHVPTRHRRTQRVRETGDDRAPLARLLRPRQPVKRRPDRRPVVDEIRQAQHRDATVALSRITLAGNDPPHHLRAGRRVRTAVVHRHNAPRHAGPVGEPVQLPRLHPDEVLAVRVLLSRDHPPGLTSLAEESRPPASTGGDRH